MAAEAQVTDILCEAMEYLTKLGSNLRSRSVSLKEKKIRKDKLKNSHAIQKAAKKVLLICELSKKSLQNVENSMKGILEQSDVLQKGIDEGGKTSTADKASSKTITISGKQYTLRIPKNVNLKHYKSVKVMTRSMPLQMMEKYPVYHKCKLYTLRKKNVKSEYNKSNENSDIESNTVQDINNEKNEQHDSSFESESKKDVTETSTNKGHKIETKKSSHSEIKKKAKANKISSEESNDSESDIKKKKSKEQSKDDNSNECDSPKKKEKTVKPYKHRKVIDDSSESENDQDTKTNKSKECELEQENRHMNKSDEVIECGFEPDDGHVAKLPVEDLEEKNVDSDTKSNKVDDSNDSCKQRKEDDENDVVVEQNVTATSVVTKPLIKCVNIDKLLKPDVSKEVKKKEAVVVHMNNKRELKSKIIDFSVPAFGANKEIFHKVTNLAAALAKKELKELEAKKNVQRVITQNDENFWVSKRQEVKDFKPKKFSINIDRLPPMFHSEFLYQNNLKRITLNGSILCEVSKDSINEDEGDIHNKTNDVIHTKKSREDLDSPIQDQVSKAKMTLLDDSYVENPSLPPVLIDETEKIKKSLLNDSESDKDKTPQKQKTRSRKCSVNKAIDNKKNKSDSLKSQHNDKVSKENNGDSQVEEEDDVSLKENNEDSQSKEENDKSLTENNEDSRSKEENNESSNINNDNTESKEENDKSLNENNEDPRSKEENNESSNINNDNSQSKEENSKILRKNDEAAPLKEETEKTLEREKTSTNKNQDQDLAKSSLLNESSGSGLETPSKKRKREDSTPQSRRKHIMENMHAKKMLLTYSSSSDTEDEKLKNVIKNIKDSLLKEMGSDEEATKESVKKKIPSSSGSESEEDILKRVRKRKKAAKTKKTKRPSPKKDKEANKSCNESENSDADMSNDSNDQSANKQSNSSNSKMGRSREKPGGSSSQNSDTRDDKDIEGLTNLNSLAKSHRRRDSDSDKADSSSTNKKKEKKMSKSPLITGEGLLEVPESSGEASGAESEGLEEDLLPPVTLPGLNGSGMEYLVKDDLLGESESDSSKDKNSDAKKDDSDSENVKARRRKANAISSDSEAGSSRRKEEKDVRLSDFEDSEEESSEPMKRSKRKKKTSDSDASAGSSNEGKKKRRRIKQMNDSDASGSDSETEGKSKHGRKNIRKVMGKNQLEEATKKAAREEKERLARIVERQKMYNNVDFDESGKPDEVVLDKVVLDFDPDTKEPLIEVDRGLVKKLKPHQANGIKFMWDACFESVKRIRKDKGSGCILAHCMGLGKTLQVVSLTHTLLTHSDLTGVNRVLVVCPLSTVLNWVNEFRMWLKHAERDYEVDVYELSRYKQNSERAFQLSQWFTHGGVCVLGYEMFRNLSADNNKKFKKKMLRQFQESLVDPGPELVVCDEGHLLKNEKTSLSQSMNRVITRRRIVLTGTPLQNNLKEYYCMVQFVKPNLLGKYNEYLNRFVNPITNGQYTDSTEHDIRVMKRRSHVLHKMLDGAVQRRDYGVLAPFLPPKHEYVLFITLTEVQIKLYQHYLDNYSRRPLPGKSSGFLFPDFQSLQRIWTHPLVLKYNSERYEIMQQKKREREEEDSEGSLVDFIDDDSTPDESSTDESSGDLSDMSDDSRKKKKKKSPKKSKTKDSKVASRRGTRANPVEHLEDEEPDPDILEVKNENPTEWWIPLVTDDEIEDMRNSHKLVLLFEILRQCEAIGDKLLVFSQSLYSLDLIEHFLGKVDEATQEGRIDEKLGGHVGSWSPGVDYFRLDGSTSCENRSIWCKNFNREDNPRARLFLISTRAGGLGINLVAANRVVIFDVSWNPSHDVQSIFRVYRFGQKKPCYVYRFLAMGTMEEKIYERQVTKQAISKRVIDEQQIDRHYAENDLAELYKFEPRPPAPRPVPLVPKDRLFAEMLKDHEAVIYKFHEHDSLLENKEEETLSEEERKAAWEDFENEKNRPPPAPFPNWPMHNGMVPNLLAQQQQQLAYAALAQMLRKDMPNLSDENIRNMLPIIYGTNPGLMQKLSDMYKYAQPGMMNPGMMNPVMSAGGGAGSMGGGGTSGLQYEPPWQRQQQQQQQMRLQQLMQQQNQMGAKFYAGGLGSRDPVAMALQQQRAREIMLGGGGGGAAGGAGRPRGRPPLQARAPPAAPADVVNLDSD